MRAKQMDAQRLKFIAVFLPQFHAIKENNAWWGEGFTEWTNVKKAAPLFDNHAQPAEPLDDNYYDLTDIHTLQWQSELMHKYNVYGLCFYHYWFGGKLLLEKPAELLLSHKEINTNFCFSWANEPWTRNWDGRQNAILMPQIYGSEQDWKAHFDYLLPFFMDERYIKVDGKPMFALYVPNQIERCADMTAYWRELAVQAGLPGLHITETLSSKRGMSLPHLAGSDACIEFEPTLTLFGGYTPRETHQFILDTLHVFMYDFVWLRMLARKSVYGKREKYCGAFMGWDNSPRVGKRASVCVGFAPEKFKCYLSQLTKKCIEEGNDRFIFINAWNEWAEGAFLEPDKQFGYGKLEAIKAVCEEFGLPSVD